MQQGGEYRGRSRRSSGWPAWGLAALAIIAPQLLGGALPQMELLILALACLMAAATAISLRHKRSTLGRTTGAIVAGWVAAGWTFLQAFPLPCRWIAASQPLRTHVVQEAVAIGALDSPLCTLSWAPGSTRVSLAMATALSATLLASMAVARTGGRDVLMRGVALSSSAMAIVALAHAATRAERVFDWYTPQQAKPPILLAPLMNSNHLGGHLALGFPLCLALGLRTKRVDSRIFWLGLAFIVLTTGFFTLSRGGTGALAAGGGGYLVVHYVLHDHARARELKQRLPLLLLGCASMFAVAAYFTADLLAVEFGNGGATSAKFSTMTELLKLLAQHPLVGVGRGALGDATPGVISGNLRVRFAENLPLHWALEWGLPAAFVVLALLAISVSTVRPRRSKEWALALGLLVLTLQNLVDFSLELAGVACVAAVALGALLGPVHIREPLGWLPRPELRISLMATSAVAALTLALVAPLMTRESKPTLQAKLEDSLDEVSDTFPAALQVALRQYPVDPTFSVLAAAHAVHSDHRSAPRWLNLALLLAPGWAMPHIQAAYHLERRGAVSQAAQELSLAFERDPGPASSSAGPFLRRHASAQYAYEMLPDRSEKRQWIAESLASGLIAAHAGREESEGFLRSVLNAFPRSSDAHARYVELALAGGDWQLALDRANEMRRNCASDPRSTATLMRVLTAAGRPAMALREFERAPALIRTDYNVLLQALAAAGATSDSVRLTTLTDEALARYGASAQARAELHMGASLQFGVAGNLGQALVHAQRSYDLSGDLSTLEHVHNLAKQAGISHVALRAATELCHVGHRGQMYCLHNSPP
jgi:tetratricopeptide (TPR) repeat protein